LACGGRRRLFLSGRRWHLGLRPVLLGGADERDDLLRLVEDEPLGVVGELDPLDVAGGVRGRQLVSLAGLLVDAADDHDELSGGPVRDRPVADSGVAPFLDRVSGDLLKRMLTEGGEEVPVEGGPVVASRARLPALLR